MTHASRDTAQRQPLHHDRDLLNDELSIKFLSASRGDESGGPRTVADFGVGRWRNRAIAAVVDAADCWKNLRSAGS